MATSPLIHLQIPSHNGHISSTSLFSSSNSVPPLRIQNQHHRWSPLRCSASSNGRPSGPTDKDSERILEEKRRAELAARIASGEFTVPESGWVSLVRAMGGLFSRLTGEDKAQRGRQYLEQEVH